MSELGRFVSRVAVFATLLFASCVALIALLVNSGPEAHRFVRRHTNLPLGIGYGPTSTPRRFQEIERQQDLDILFLGSSHAYQSFDTRCYSRLGLKTFNMGSMGQPPLNTYYLLTNHLDRLAPKLIVFEVYWELLGDPGLESFLDLVANLPISTEILQMTGALRSSRALSALIARLTDRRRPYRHFVEAGPTPFATYVPGGFVEAQPGACKDIRHAPPPHAIEISNRQLKYLDRIIEIASARRVEIVLVLQPVPASTRATLLNLDEVNAVLEALASQHEVPFLDFNRLMSLSDLDFCDYHHLS